MKRHLVLALAGMLLVAGPVSAQTIGFKVGGTYSNVDFDDPDGGEFDWMSGLGVGGFVRFGLAGLALQVDVLGVTKGAEVADPVEGDFNFKLEYVDVPVQLVFAPGASRFSPYLMVGPSFGFETGCEVELEVDDGNNASTDCGDEEGRKTTDIGLTGAAGLQIPLGPGSLLLEGRYTHGLTNLVDDDGQNNDGKMRNRMFGVFAGYSIPLGR